MKKMNTTDFCNKSNIKHNNIYDYSLVNYINNRTKVKIICKEHGIFEQIPDSHLRGFGCTKCSGNYNYTNNEFIEKLKYCVTHFGTFNPEAFLIGLLTLFLIIFFHFVSKLLIH
mgnify:CR=1 FL=1